MSKLPAEAQFFDASDYGRFIAVFLANRLKNTKLTPVHATLLFGICGLIAVYCILNGHFITAGFCLILKSIIDALDGELSRAKNTPSYTGRYLDSIFDIVLNFLFLAAIGWVSATPFWLTLLAFICIQLQGTLYNYYYVILRHHSKDGDTTSQIFETEAPMAMLGENQITVNVLFSMFYALYGGFDKIIYILDKDACRIKAFPNWFMTLVSGYGLGFQLLLMAVLLALNLAAFIAPFFIVYSVFIVVLIGIRRTFLKVS